MVVGFLVLGGLIIYLILTLILVWVGTRYARKRGKPGWKGGVPVLVIMYLLLFWDLIPTHAVHRYYCATEGGFTVNKSLEQWKAENPGVTATLEPIKNAPWIATGEKTRIPLNQRFAWDRYERRHLFGVREREERIVDTETGETLARYVDFDTDIRAVERGIEARGLRDYKFWLATESCERAGQNMPKRKFNEFYHLLKYQEEIDL
jgi:hypothetical protein